MDLADYRFSPAQLRVGRGQSVAFTFTDDTADDHSFTIDGLDVHVRVPSGRTRTTGSGAWSAG
ncbi:cupredoxin domain-containing protein [Saccharothrix syringae]|uniref:Plastocyanin-like domain-containing protein n=1 Tax=Saccharothrix syringae TaxID=103733 RepID=A0A5Q0H0V1_SACSY|nr:hypothetical protein [Saccharothrix syringae]QFZ19808.1 hypothetical protein EKG83_22380 [Saccharothrix syringae]